MTNRRYRHKRVVIELERAGESRAPVLGHQAGVRLCEDALSGLGEERAPVVRDQRADEF